MKSKQNSGPLTYNEVTPTVVHSGFQCKLVVLQPTFIGTGDDRSVRSVGTFLLLHM